MQRYNAHAVSPACDACIPNMGWLRSAIWQVLEGGTEDTEDTRLELKSLDSVRICQMIQIVQPEEPRWCRYPLVVPDILVGHWQRSSWKEMSTP